MATYAVRWRCRACARLAFCIDDAPAPTKCAGGGCKWIGQHMGIQTAILEISNMALERSGSRSKRRNALAIPSHDENGFGVERVRGGAR